MDVAGTAICQFKAFAGSDPAAIEAGRRGCEVRRGRPIFPAFFSHRDYLFPVATGFFRMRM
jgi:hypothetical protein